MKSAPFPYKGQKRNYIKDITTSEELKNIIKDDYIIIDVFGGSGLLSHTFANLFPNNQIIYNDYDYYLLYFDLYPHLKEFDKKINEIIKNIKYNHKKELLTEQQQEQIKDIFKNMFDYFETLFNTNEYFKNLIYNNPNLKNDLMNKIKLYYTSRMCFNGRNDNLLKCDLYSGTLKEININYNDYITSNITITNKDYKELINECLKKYDHNKLFFIFDPPYMYTDKSGYYNIYFNMLDSLTLLKLIHDNNIKGLYFNTYKNGLIEVIKMFDLFKFKILFEKKGSFKQSAANVIQIQNNKDYLMLIL